MNIIYQTNKNLDKVQLEKLYGDAGWSAYTNDMNRLQQAIRHSFDVISAWDEGKLVGLVRTISDGLTIVYIQDILVLGAYRNHGIASELMQVILKNHKHVRQKVLLTGEAPDVRHFYEKNGFHSCDQGQEVAFGQFR